MSLNAYSQSLEALRNQKSHELKEVGDQWRTPELLFWGINAMFGPLMLDLFADDSNAKCPVWYTAEDNALTQDWSEMLASIGGAAFGNPPYSRSQYDGKQAITGMSHIMSYASAMREKGGRYVFLIKAAPSETWWPEDADHIVFIRTSAFFAGAIVVFDKTWRGERFSYIHRSDLEAKGRAFMSLAQFAAEKVAPPAPAEEVTSAAVDLPEVESRIWPLEVGLVFNQVKGADSLELSQQNKLKANINQLWLERMPTSKIITVAGGLPGLEHWLERNACECQYPQSDYHHHELVTMRHAPGAMMLCWHCDNKLREQSTELLAGIARRNVIDWIIDTVLVGLRFNRERELSIAELCWWAIYVGVADAIPEELAARVMQMPYEPFPSVYKESDIIAADNRPTVALQRRIKTAGSLKRCMPQGNQQVMQEQQPKVIALSADPESPESFMLRPKRRRWENEKYTRWVKSQPCECCRRPADDPHHVIGHGMGGTATKAHDLFVFPLCRECHDKLYADVAAFEQKHGTQLDLLFRFLDRALAIGAIVKA